MALIDFVHKPSFLIPIGQNLSNISFVFWTVEFKEKMLLRFTDLRKNIACHVQVFQRLKYHAINYNLLKWKCVTQNNPHITCRPYRYIIWCIYIKDQTTKYAIRLLHRSFVYIGPDLFTQNSILDYTLNKKSGQNRAFSDRSTEAH